MKTEDIRITQYALGELTGSAREAFEKQMAADPELLEEVRRTQQFCESVPTELEPEAAFADEAREALLERIRKNRFAADEGKQRGIWSRLVVYGGLAAAACFLVTLSVPAVNRSAHLASRENELPLGSEGLAVPAEPKPAATPVTISLVSAETEPLAAPQPPLFADLALEPSVQAPGEWKRQVNDSPKSFYRSTEPANAKVAGGAEVATPASAESAIRELYASGGVHNERIIDTRAGALAVLSESPAVSTAPSAQLASGNLPANKQTPIRGDIPLTGRLFGAAAPAADVSSSRLLAGNASGNAELAKAPVTVTTRSGNSAHDKIVREFIYAGEFHPENAGYHLQPGEFNTEGYDYQEENRFLTVRENPLSTFSVDVDTASYSNVRRFLQQQGQLPPKGAVRIEELVNYFPYTYPQPAGEEPFSVNVEVSKAPWNAQHELVRVGLKGRELSAEKRPASNLVFLVDVSGSMNQPDKLPLLKRSLTELTSRLGDEDQVAIVVYAGSSGLVLPSTPDKSAIRSAIKRLKAGGSTNGGEGIKLAYREARENFVEEGNNRVILCTDGDFNVGITDEQALVNLIEKERKSGVFLSVLGFGTGNLKDSQMEKLADKGNGNYAYIDSISEGRKVLGEQMSGTLFTIAKDVKIQVEFNPATVAGYRLIGYENRLLAKEDFNNDKKDAGEIGAGHTVTAFYEVIPAGQPLPEADSVDPLKYQATAAENPKSEIRNPKLPELLTVKLRYKQPDGDTSKLLEVPVPNEVREWKAVSEDFRFGAAVAAFGQKLRGSKNLKNLDWAEIQKLARPNLGDDPGSYRAEFLTLIEKARQIDENP